MYFVEKFGGQNTEGLQSCENCTPTKKDLGPTNWSVAAVQNTKPADPKTTTAGAERNKRNTSGAGRWEWNTADGRAREKWGSKTN